MLKAPEPDVTESYRVDEEEGYQIFGGCLQALAVLPKFYFSKSVGNC
jgi:hypothetical protein